LEERVSARLSRISVLALNEPALDEYAPDPSFD
jgi:hypothetical protein